MKNDLPVPSTDEYEIISADDRPKIQKIWEVYYFDATERTFLCEGTPS